MHHEAEVGRERDVGELEMKPLRQVNGHRVSSCIISDASRSPQQYAAKIYIHLKLTGRSCSRCDVAQDRGWGPNFVFVQRALLRFSCSSQSYATINTQN